MPISTLRTAVNQRLNVGGSTGMLNRATGSIMGWFRASTLATSRGIYSEYAAFNKQITIEMTSGHKLQFTWRTAAAIAQFSTSGNVDDGVWHWFLFVKRASNDFQGWVDGTSVATSSNAVGTDATASTISIGNFTSTNADNVSSSDLFRFISLREAIGPVEALSILTNGLTGRGKLWHFELDGRLPEGSHGGTGEAYFPTVATGVTNDAVPPGTIPIYNGVPKGYIDWIVSAVPFVPPTPGTNTVVSVGGDFGVGFVPNTQILIG